MKTLLFADGHHISYRLGIYSAEGDHCFRCCPPPKPSAPFLVADKPWEAMSLGWGTMLLENGKYRLWYEAWGRDYGVEYGADFDGRLCYAESNDGVHWTKPNLGLISYRGSKDNNIVIDGALMRQMGFHGHSIFIDPTGSKEERYRCVFYGKLKSGPDRSIGIIAFAYSQDGLHWHWGLAPKLQNVRHTPIMPYGSDTQNVVFWDKSIRKYVGYFRAWGANEARCIARSETVSLWDWPIPQMILKPEGHEPTWCDYYNNAVSVYASGGDRIYLMFISLYDHKEDTLHVRLATSRDGVFFDRLDRTPFILNNSPYDKGGIYTTPGIHRAGDGLRLCYLAATRKHEEHEANVSYDGGFVMLDIKKDRFQGLHAQGKYEFALSEDIGAAPSHITLNADIKGSIRAGLILGNAFAPGYAPQDCVAPAGDGTALALSWRGRENSPLPAHAVLKLFLDNATLYSVSVHRI